MEVLPGVIGNHPRLLFDAEGLIALRAAIAEPPLKSHYDTLLGYLGASVPPGHTNFLTNATDAQRQGLWRLPTVALHYALTGDSTSFNRTKEFMDLLLSLDHWEIGGEVDSGMSAGNIMIGAALAYDWLCNDLEPGYREDFRQKLFHQARAMFHSGHVGGAGGYWQADPQNNHRWHRNAGLALCLLAAYEGNPEEEWMLRQLHDELSFVSGYLPEDGTSHESPTYLVFGTSHLALAFHAADNCLGTDFLDQPFFENVARFRVQTIAPGFNHFFMYGDGSDAPGFYNHFAYLAAQYHGQSTVLDALETLDGTNAGAFQYGWFGVVWRGTELSTGNLHDLPLADHFEDLGLTFMREGWESGDAAAMFKSGPLGGFRLNEFRDSPESGGWLNVAHDDPDANSFLLFKDDEWVAETSRYSHAKRSSNHNTLLVNGVGQRAAGRNEGMFYSQPSVGGDMRQMAYVTREEDNGDVVITEGEASGSYTDHGGVDSRIDRFRRSFIWRSDRYVLILDDIRASVAKELTWLIQSGDVLTRDDADLAFSLSKHGVVCHFQVAASEDLSASKVNSTADHRGDVLGWKQLRLSATTGNLQIASVYDLWEVGGLEVQLNNLTATGAQVVVSGNGIHDIWDWVFATDSLSASQIVLAAAPSIRAAPAVDPISVNQSATVEVFRGGLGPIDYQWYFGPVGDTGTPVGDNSPVLATGPIAEPRHYWVRISNPYGSVESDGFRIDLTNGFYVWSRRMYPEGPHGMEDDANENGVVNFVEYALGTDSSSGSAAANRPHAGLEDGWFRLRFVLPEGGLPDVSYEVQTSTDLEEWTSVLSKSGHEEWTGDAPYDIGQAEQGRVPMTVDLLRSVEMEPMESELFTRLKLTRETDQSPPVTP